MFATMLCQSCAASSEIAIEIRPPAGLAIVLRHGSGRSRPLLWTDRGRPEDPRWLGLLEVRTARLREIARDAALIDDPALLAKLDDYVSQVGYDQLALGAIERKRAAEKLLASVAELVSFD